MKASTFERLRELWALGDPSQEAGREIFDAIKSDRRPGWAANILEWCAGKFGQEIREVRSVIEVAQDDRRWHEAHGAFDQVRDQTLQHDRPGQSNRKLVALLYVAEIAAKVTYNAAGTAAPFDHDSGWWMARVLHHFVTTLDEPEGAEREAWDLLVAPLRRSSGVN
jgi:hypothetical protein